MAINDNEPKYVVNEDFLSSIAFQQSLRHSVIGNKDVHQLSLERPQDGFTLG